MRWCLVLALLCGLPGAGCADKGAAAPDPWLVENLVALPESASGGPLVEDVRPGPGALVQAIPANARVVALGEEQHGVREFTGMKARLVAELVSHRGYRTLVLEQGPGDVAPLDRWIAGEGNVDSIPDERLYWTWRSRSFRELLGWLRAFNAGRDEGDRLRLRGVDVQTPASTWREIAAVLDVGAGADPRLEEAVRPLIASPWTYAAQPEAVRQACREAIATLAVLEPPHTAVSGQLADLVANLVVTEAHLRISDRKASFESRDSLMAAGVMELCESEPVLFWGHNAHVMKLVGPSQPYSSMGVHLARRLPGSFVSIGLLAGRGRALMDPRYRDPGGSDRFELEARPGSWNELLLDAARRPAWWSMVDAPDRLGMIRETTWGAIPLRGAFDFVVFVPVVDAIQVP